MNIELDINGETVSVSADPGSTLLTVLRANGHTEVKNGCGEGDCGACMVLLDGKAVPSCQVLAASAAGRKIRTVKALGNLHEASILQRSFIEEGAVQCGFCTSGMLISAWALLAENPDPSEDDILHALDGNLCRCTGYVKIVRAVRRAARELAAGSGKEAENG